MNYIIFAPKTTKKEAFFLPILSWRLLLRGSPFFFLAVLARKEALWRPRVDGAQLLPLDTLLE